MIDIYKHDWFVRDDDYTFSNKKIKLGWEGIVGSEYSKYLYSNSIVRVLLSNDNELKDELYHINQMMGLYNNIVIDDKGSDSYTDGNTIVISKEHTKSAKSDFDKMDVLIGLLLHESAHCLYTDFGYVKSNKKAITKITHIIHNVIEDEMIEQKLGHDYPGYVNFISKVKYYFFGIFGNRITDNVPVNELDMILKIFLYIIRYPKHIQDIDNKILQTYEELFVRIKEILRTYQCFDIETKQSTTIRSINAAIKITELLKKYIDGDSDLNTLNSSKKQSDACGTFSQQLAECKSKDKSVLNGITVITTALGSESEYTNEVSERIDTIIEDNSERIEKKYIGKGCKLGTSKKRHNNILRYNSLLKTVQPFIKDAKKLILPNAVKEVLKIYNHRRNGSLDPNRLADAMQDCSQVFQQRIIERKNTIRSKYALVLVLDESGSMRGIHDFVTSLAILIYEAVHGFSDIELYIYGHGDVINTYIDKYHKSKYILGDCDLQGDQNEAESYKIIIDKVRKQTNLPIVCISFTDSCYCTNIKLLTERLDEYRRHNCSFNLVCIGDDGLHSVENINNRIYGEGNWVVYKNASHTDIKQMINKLALVIRKNYDKYNK